MTITKVHREYSRSVLVKKPQNGIFDQWITVKSGMEAIVGSEQDAIAARIALDALVEIDVETTLKKKLGDLGITQ